MHDRSTCYGVHKENFRPCRSATVGRVDLDFGKHFVERCESLGLFLEELPKPVMEHSVQSFDVARKPRFTHHTMQVLLCSGQMFPFNNREHDNPHASGPELLKNPVTRSRRSQCVFDIHLAEGGNNKQRGDFKQIRAECGGWSESVWRSSDMEAGVTCLVPQTEAQKNVAESAVSSASVISSFSVRQQAMV